MEKSGFSTLLQKNVLLQVNLPATVELKMEVGNVSQTIAVEAEAPPINTQDATIGNAFNQTQVRQLPLLTRNVVELLSQQAGVTATGEVLGARKDQNNVTLDGADVNDNQSAGAFTAVLPVPLDSVQEFRVTVGGQGPIWGEVPVVRFRLLQNQAPINTTARCILNYARQLRHGGSNKVGGALGRQAGLS